MDITKIKIGAATYDVKDEIARTSLSSAQETLVRNIMTYGIADITNKTQAELAQMAANMQQYGTPDTTDISQAQLEQMLENMQRYGVANVDGLTDEQKEALASAHNAAEIEEADPMFATWKNSVVVDGAGVLTLV